MKKYSGGRFLRPVGLVVSGLVALVFAGCMGEEWPAPEPVVFAEFAQGHQEWRVNRQERLVR